MGSFKGVARDRIGEEAARRKRRVGVRVLSMKDYARMKKVNIYDDLDKEFGVAGYRPKKTAW